MERRRYEIAREDFWAHWVGGLFSKIVSSWYMKSSEEGILKRQRKCLDILHC